MLSFGMAYYINANKLKIPVTIEVISNKYPTFGCVKADQKATYEKPFVDCKYGEHGTWQERHLYDLIDMYTGYVLARTYKGELKEAIKTITEYGFQHTENGKYVAPNGFEINSILRYYQ